MNKFFDVKQVLFLSIIATFFFTACEKDEPTEVIIEKGVFITNEGGYGKNNASVSYYNYTTDAVTNDIFENANGYGVGDVLQSLCIYGKSIYLVVNNSSKIEVVADSNFKSTGVITGLPLPRYMVTSDENGYISCWGDNSIHVANLETLEIIDTIAVGSGPERMLVKDNQLLVTNSGGYGKDSTLTVVDLSTQKVTKTIQVGYNPRDIETDINGDLWVLCYGIESWDGFGVSTPSELVLLDGNTLQIKSRLLLSGLAHASVLDINKEGNTLYFGGGYSFEGVYKLPIDGVQATQIVADLAYGFSIVKERNELFVTISDSWTTSGKLKRYNLEGVLLGTYTVGIGPNGAISTKSASRN